MESINKSLKNLKALVIGATGATGRELTELLLNSNCYSNVYVIVRRKIDRWENLNESQKKKLKVILCDDLDILSKELELQEKLDLPANENISTVFCCLGSRVGKGEAEFRKVDYEYVVNTATLCEKLKIPHFSLISSTGANPNSWFLYMRTKGQADEECLKINIPYVSIFRPGLIMDRDNDSRIAEKCLKYLPFLSKLKSSELAEKMLIDDLNYHSHNEGNSHLALKNVYTHSEILKITLV